MTTIAVQSITESEKTPGKFMIKDASGAFWDAWEVARQMKVGGTYDVEFKSREYNGKTYRTISKAIAQSNGHAQSAAPQTHAPLTNGAIAPDRGGVPPHVSNWVAHAIAAGKIQDAPDMIRWAQWAFQAGMSMNQRPTDASEDAPF